MKKIMLVLVLSLMAVGAFAQSVSQTDVKRFNVTQDTKVPFRLYPTANTWNFLKLDTRTGQIWAVQYTIDSKSKSFTWTIDDTPIESETEQNVGRFTLYPTTNNYNFILLDQFNGRTWQVQYSLDSPAQNFRWRIW